MDNPPDHELGLLMVDLQVPEAREVREASVEALMGDNSPRSTLTTPVSNDGVTQIMNELRNINASMVQMNTQMVQMNTQMGKMNTQMVQMNTQMGKMNAQIVLTNCIIISTIIVGAALYHKK
ncbi:unnamed protein product [Rotaria magnacalcarata]|uniref:Uncharacterized protein n=1 Tax=Rotaria magnacalcarata TaxID=392030 RepID=A0A816PAG3_9BILA|nr:unnamed protein product [Rotaria magnacalcarata]